MVRSLFLAACVLLIGIAQACAGGVAIILSMNNDSVQGMQESFLSTLADRSFAEQPTVYNLKEKDAATITSLVQAQAPVMALAVGSEAAKLVKSLQGIPGVYTIVTNNAEFDAANLTGISIDVPPQLRLELVKSVLPDVKRIGVLYSQATAQNFDEIAAAGKSAGLAIVGRSVATEGDFLPAVQALMGGQADCILMIIDTKVYFGQSVKTMLLESLKNKVPVVGLSMMFTKAGAAMSVDCDYHDLGRQAGEIAARILKGEKPSAIRSQRPRKAQYSLNMQMITQLGKSLAGSAVSGASEVVR